MSLYTLIVHQSTKRRSSMKKFKDLEVKAYFALADSIRKTGNPAHCIAGSAGIDVYRKVNIKTNKGPVVGAILLSDCSVFEGFNAETEVVEVFL